MNPLLKYIVFLLFVGLAHGLQPVLFAVFKLCCNLWCGGNILAEFIFNL